ADGEADGDWDGVASGLAVSCCVLGAGPALKPRLEAEPWSGDTSRNAATMTPAMATGPTPNSRTFISVLRPLHARVQPAGLASRDRPGIPRRGGTAALANGPAAGCPLGYQPTVGPSSVSDAGSGGGTEAAEAGPGSCRAGLGSGRAGLGSDGAGPGAERAGPGAGGGGGGGEEAPKLGGIPPGLACSP